MKKALLMLGVAAAFGTPVAAHATIWEFNANLSGANENPPTASTATGVATLFYNDFNTASIADDRYNFALSAFGLTGEATAYHIHGAATPAENAPVRIPLDTAPFVSSKIGTTLLVGGNNVAPLDPIPATTATGTNAGHPSMSFIDMLKSGLAYTNVHTVLNPGGEIRGQLIEVNAVPEPQTYALMLAGLGFVGWVASRKRARM